MKIVEKISIEELKTLSEKMYEPLVKAVVDVERRVLVVDAGLHSDEELYLLEQGSSQQDLWGVNFWPDEYGTDNFVEFDSMINLRPGQGNRSRGVDDEAVRNLILQIVSEKMDV
ncbi:MAG: DUF5674 family protein [Clostridiales bacterium]|nr:DUF5674 family protein [Clostridiales bacterium]